VPLKPTLTKADYDALQPPEQFAYRADGDRFVLDVDLDALPEVVAQRAKVAEFRDSNRALNTKVAELEGRLAAFDGIDPEKARQVLDGSQPALAEQLAAADAARQKAEGQLASERLRSAVVAEAGRLGVRPEAVDYVLQKAGGAFRVDAEGRVIATDGAGFNPDRPGERLSLPEWVAGLTAAAPFLLAPSFGGGTPPQPRGPRPPVPGVSRHDALAVGKNLEAIAAGKIRVTD
jgi:hypothetical protein